jgi:acetylornithine deacetylase
MDRLKMSNKNIVYDEIARLLPEYTAFLSKLVRINSSYCAEKEAQLFVKSKMESFGLQVRTFLSRSSGESMNLAAKIRGTDSKNSKSLILNAHCDTAPVDDPGRWSRSPISGEVAGGRLFGRGAQDDKAGIAVILLAANVLKNLGVILKGDLIIESVIEEETTGNGSKVLVENGYTADGVLICDGTWSGRIIYAHLGQIWVDVEIKGEPVAACVQQRGVNPIYIAMEFVGRLKEYFEELNSRYGAFEGIERPYFINAGSIHSGSWHGSVPSSAKLEIQAGFSGRSTPDEIILMISDIAKKISPKINVKEGLLKTASYKAKKDNQLISALKTIIENNLQKEVSVVPVTGHCDIRHFPTGNICLYGPGGGENPHGVDESYQLDEMPKVAVNIVELVMGWCNESKR